MNNTFELGLACIVLIGYIVGKVWMYHTIDSKDSLSKFYKDDKEDS